MNRTPDRQRRHRLQTLTLAPLWLLAPPLAAQLPQRELPRPQEFIASQDDNLFSLARSQEEIHLLEQAIEELGRGQHAAAVARLHRLLQADSGGVVPVGPGRFLGMRLAAVQTMANLPPAAAEAYAALVQREAGSLLRVPVDRQSPEQLLVLATRYPAARVGQAARLRLGDLALEAGDGTTAVGHFRAALDATAFGSADERAALDRLQAAAALERPHDHRGLTQAMGAVGDVLSVMPAEGDDPSWPALGGGGGGATPMSDPVGSPRSQWTVEVTAPGFEYDNGPLAMHAVGDLSAIFINNGVRLLAFDPLRKTLLWSSPAPLEQVGEIVDLQRQYEGAINQDMVLAAACAGDVVVAHLQVPEESDNVAFRHTFRIMSKIPERRLFAFHRGTGKLLWSHFDNLTGPISRRFRGHAACGPPLIVGDTVYLPTHDRSGAIAFYLSAYDLRTGEPRWRRLICSSQQEVNMFGNARSEFAASPLCTQDGVIYGCSNLGVAYAADRADGRLRWIHAYEVTELPQTRLHGQDRRPTFFANNAPVCSDGVLALTPLDSFYVVGIDTETGRTLWRLPYAAKANGNNDVFWLLGARDGGFLLAGKGVVSVRARPEAAAGPFAEVRQVQRREYLWDREPGPGALARGALTPEFVYFPAPGRLGIFDLRGNLAPHAGSLRLPQPGNLLLVDGMVVALRYGMLEIQYDPEALRLRAEARLRVDDDDPAAILRLCMLRRALLGDRPDPAAAQALQELFRRGLQAAERKGLPPSHPLRRELAGELFRSALQQAQAAAAAGHPDALRRLRDARALAPDAASWIRAQELLLTAIGRDEAQAVAELDLLSEQHGAERFAFADTGSLLVRTWVLWRKAAVLRDPAAALLCWQELLEFHADELIGDRPVGPLAQATIAEAIQRLGRGVYAAIEARAAAGLAQAGADPDRLRALALRFPHSEAAAGARARLLDLAVERGDLGAAVDMLAHALGRGEAPPGLLRRALAAARQSGNRGLADGIAAHLQRSANATSDFAPDRGRTYGAVLADLASAPPDAPPPPTPAVPQQVVATIAPRAPHAGFSLPRVLRPDGFVPPPAPPLYVVHQEAVQAFDPTTNVSEPLFQIRVTYLETLALCGKVLVVPDLAVVAGHDHRTGARLWELPNPGQRIYECLGVQAGVLHLCVQSPSPDADAELLGLEPLTGRILFRRELPGRRYPSIPKAAAGQLLLMELAADGGTLLHRLDPITGNPVATVPLAAAAAGLGLRTDVPVSRLFPQTLAADQDRIYVPVDGPQGDGAPALGALEPDGSLAWTWRGTRGRRLLMAGLRGDRLAVVEAGGRSGGRIAVLRARDGAVLAERDLDDAVQVLNWQRTWLPEPAPRLLVVVDRAPGRRLTGFALEDGLPSFQQALAPDDGEGVAQALVGADFVTLAVRPAQRGPLRIYCLRLQDRSGALPDSRKFLPLPLLPPYGVTQSGAYTLISSLEGMTVLGDPGTPR